MAMLYSNEIKAVVIADEFQGIMQNVLREKCMTIQHFDYHCEYKRNQSSELYGSMDPVTVNFTVRINSLYQARVFYKNLVSAGNFEYTFLFNPTFNASQRLSGYEDGMVVDGYVVSVEEKYNSTKNGENRDEQLMLDVQILIRSVVYLGREKSSNLKSVFIQ